MITWPQYWPLIGREGVLVLLESCMYFVKVIIIIQKTFSKNFENIIYWSLKRPVGENICYHHQMFSLVFNNTIAWLGLPMINWNDQLSTDALVLICNLHSAYSLAQIEFKYGWCKLNLGSTLKLIWLKKETYLTVQERATSAQCCNFLLECHSLDDFFYLPLLKKLNLGFIYQSLTLF